MAHDDVRSSFAEAYRSVRTALQFSTRDGAPRVFMVTSTAQGDGKTTTALALAINSAQTGLPVLLIDADMRHPAVHKALAIDNSRGLSNFLSSDVPALGVVRTTDDSEPVRDSGGADAAESGGAALRAEAGVAAGAARRPVHADHRRRAAGARPRGFDRARRPGRRGALRRRVGHTRARRTRAPR